MEYNAACTIQRAWRCSLARTFCKTIRRRIHIVNEIVENERKYVSNLAYISILYEQPLLNLLQEGKPLVSGGTIQAIFKDIQSILKVHTVLLRILNGRLKSWEHDSTIGDCFVEIWNEVSELYSAYVLGTQTTMKLVNKEMAKNVAFKSFLKSQRNSDPDASSLTLEDLLMMPVQRIPRYELLIVTMLKHTTTTHTDYKYLKKALAAVRHLATSIDDQKKQVEATHRESYLFDELMSYGVMPEPHRRLIKEYNVVELVRSAKGKHRRKRRLFIFNDTIVCGKAARQKNDVLDDTMFIPKWMTFLQSCSSRVGYTWEVGPGLWDDIEVTLKNFVVARDAILSEISDSSAEPAVIGSSTSQLPHKKWGGTLNRKHGTLKSSKSIKTERKQSVIGSLSLETLPSRKKSGSKKSGKESPLSKRKLPRPNLFEKFFSNEPLEENKAPTRTYTFTGNECTRWLGQEYSLTNEECILLCQEMLDKDRIALVNPRGREGRFAVEVKRDLTYRIVPESERPKIDITDKPSERLQEEMNATTRQISVERQIAGAADRIGSSSAASKKIGSSSGRSQAKKHKETIMAKIKELESTLSTLRETQGVCSQRYSLHLVSYACHTATDHTGMGSVEGLTTGTTVGNGAVGVPGQGKARLSPNDGDVESEAFGQNSGLSVRTVFFPTQMARDEVLEQLLPAVTRQSMCTMESLNQYLNQAEERDTGNEVPHTPEFMSAVSRLSWLDVDDTAKRGIYSFTKKGSKRMVRRDYVICCQRPSEPPDASSSMSSFDTNSQWGASWSSLAEPSLITLGKPSPLIVKRGSISSATSMLLHHKESHKQQH